MPHDMQRDACSEASGRENGSYSSCQSWTREATGRWAGSRRPRDRKASGLPMAKAELPGHGPTLAPTLRQELGAIVTFARRAPVTEVSVEGVPVTEVPVTEVPVTGVPVTGVSVDGRVSQRSGLLQGTLRRPRKYQECPARSASALTGGPGVSTCRRSAYVKGRPRAALALRAGEPAPTSSVPGSPPARPPSRRALLARLAIRSAGASAAALALLGAMTPNEANAAAPPPAAAAAQHFRNPIS